MNTYVSRWGFIVSTPFWLACILGIVCITLARYQYIGWAIVALVLALAFAECEGRRVVREESCTPLE